MRGGAELVALWAQLAGLMELVSGVALAGVGTGLAVYAARSRSPQRQGDLLREALRMGLAVSLPAALAVAAIGALFADALSGGKLPPALVAIGAAAGWVAVIPGLMNNLWLGQQHRARMLALALGSASLALAVALLAPAQQLLPLLAISQALPAVVIFLAARNTNARPRFRSRSHPLRRYLLPGISIGILSPASMLVARSVVGESLSWHEAGVLQALWRVSDWVFGLTSGILSVYFLPRFAAARASPQLYVEMRRAFAATVLPAAAVFAALFFAHRPLLAALYQADFAAPDAAVALLFAGNVARIASWIPLFALYAMRRTRAIAVGELLSLPLFAALLALAGERLSLAHVGAFWLAAFAAYCAFNFWAARRA